MRLLSVGIAVLLSANVAQANAYFDEQDKQLQRYLEDLKSRCKANFSAKIDRASFEKVVASEEKRRAENLYAHCNVPIRAITQWCANGMGDSIGKEIKSYTCRYAEGPSQASLEGSDLVVTTSWSKDGSAWSKAAQVQTGRLLRKGAFSAGQALVIRENEDRLKDLLLDLPRNCKGYELDWKVDWKSFLPLIDARLGQDPSHAIWQECYEPLRALTQRCDKGQGELVKAQVRSYVCQYDANAETELSLKEGAYVLTTNMQKEKRQWYADRLGDQLIDGAFVDGQALSVRQTDFMKEQDQDFKRVFADEFEYKCGAPLTWSIAWASFVNEVDKRLAKEETTSIYDACGVPINRLMDVCATDSKVAAKVKKKIKRFSCTFGGKRKRKLSLKKKTLVYRVDFGAKDAYGFVDRFLVKKRILKKRPPPKKLSADELAKIRRILGSGVSPVQRCKRACSKQCRGASNRSKCKSRCRARCG